MFSQFNSHILLLFTVILRIFSIFLIESLIKVIDMHFFFTLYGIVLSSLTFLLDRNKIQLEGILDRKKIRLFLLLSTTFILKNLIILYTMTIISTNVLPLYMLDIILFSNIDRKSILAIIIGFIPIITNIYALYINMFASIILLSLILIEKTLVRYLSSMGLNQFEILFYKWIMSSFFSFVIFSFVRDMNMLPISVYGRFNENKDAFEIKLLLKTMLYCLIRFFDIWIGRIIVNRIKPISLAFLIRHLSLFFYFYYEISFKNTIISVFLAYVLYNFHNYL